MFVGVKINRKKKVQFYIDLLPKHNIWIRLEQDFEYDIWLCIRKEFRIYINFFIDTIYELFTKFTLKYRLYLKRYFLKKERLYSFFITYDQLINIKIFYFNCKTNKFNDKKIIIIYFIQKFSNPLSYNLGSIGRKKINKYFYKIFPISIQCIVSYDFFELFLQLNNVKSKKISQRFNDFDNLRIRRIYTKSDIFIWDLYNIIFCLNLRY